MAVSAKNSTTMIGRARPRQTRRPDDLTIAESQPRGAKVNCRLLDAEVLGPTFRRGRGSFPVGLTPRGCAGSLQGPRLLGAGGACDSSRVCDAADCPHEAASTQPNNMQSSGIDALLGEAQLVDPNVATVNGVTMKRTPGGLEILALEETSGAGVALRGEGFVVGDCLTAIGGADMIGRAPGEIFQWITDEASNNGAQYLLRARSYLPTTFLAR
jgi:hypothetical protein